MATACAKTELVRAFMTNDVLLTEEGAELLLEFISRAKDSEESIQQLLEAREAVAEDAVKVTKGVAESILRYVDGASESKALVQVISAFAAPNIRYDHIRKTFYKDTSRRELVGCGAEARMQLYLDRFYLLHQQLARNPALSRPVLPDLAEKSVRELTEIKALLGLVGRERTIMGFFRGSTEEGFSLEDLSGSIKLELSDTTKLSSGFFIEEGILVADGRLKQNSAFEVFGLSLPPCVKRAEALRASKGWNFFGGMALNEVDTRKCRDWEEANPEDRIIFLSDIWLDKQQPSMTAKLDAILSVYEGLEQPPSAFVFIGNFHSFSCTTAATNYAALRDNFASLARLLAKHTRLLDASQFVFVPGPQDPGPATALPRPPLPVALTSELRRLPNAHFATNPCRLRYFGHEIVIFRYDLQKRLRKTCLLQRRTEETGEAKSASLFKDTATTVIQQLHLCPGPVSNQAVFWRLDNALRLYPLPAALVVADAAAAAEFGHPEVSCVNPGSLASGTFAAYRLSTQEVELCEVPDE